MIGIRFSAFAISASFERFPVLLDREFHYKLLYPRCNCRGNLQAKARFTQIPCKKLLPMIGLLNRPKPQDLFDSAFLPPLPERSIN
jgi:hypothetical protein